MIGRLLPAAALLLLLTSRVEAAPINLLLTVDLYEPTVGPREIKFGYRIFQSATNRWPSLDSYFGGCCTDFLPGVWQFHASIDAESLDNAYFYGLGFYGSFPPPSFYVAEPPTGRVSDALASTYGAPWISLANMGGGFGGELWWISGYDRGPIGTWALSAAPTELAPVPEPASMLLLGSGLAAVIAKKYRQSKPKRPVE